MLRLFDDFRPVVATEVAFLNRGKGIDVPDVQSAIEKIYMEINRTNPTLEIVSVKDFGAKGDGSTDDTVAVQNAVSFVAMGGVVYFPRGTYRISSISIPENANIILRGESPETTFITKLPGESFIRGNNASIGLENMSLINEHPEDNFIGFYYNRTMKNITVNNIRYYGGRAFLYNDPSYPSSVDNLVIKNTRIANTQRGVQLGTVKQAVIVNNEFLNLTGGSDCFGVWIGENDYEKQKDTRNIIVTNNIFKNIKGGSGEIHGVLLIGRNIIITNNIFENIVDGWNNDESIECEAIYVKGINTIINNNLLINAGLTEGCIVAKPSAEGQAQSDNVTISGNIIINDENTPSASIMFSGLNAQIFNNKIYGNGACITSYGRRGDNYQINNNMLIGNGGRIEAFNANNVVIKNNIVIREDEGHSVRVATWGRHIKNITIEGNYLEAPNKPGHYYASIRLDNSTYPNGKIEDVIIQNNTLKNYKGILVELSQASVLDGLFIKNNHFDGDIGYDTSLSGDAVIKNVAKIFNFGIADESKTPPYENPKVGYIYLDDGSNTSSGTPKLMRYNGTDYDEL